MSFVCLCVLSLCAYDIYGGQRSTLGDVPRPLLTLLSERHWGAAAVWLGQAAWSVSAPWDSACLSSTGLTHEHHPTHHFQMDAEE